MTWATFLEHDAGSLQAGKSADLVVLSQNVLSVTAKKIGFSWMGGGGARALMTMFQGKKIYTAGESAGSR